MRYRYLLLCAFVSLPARAQVNKCNVQGRIVYQAAPCAKGTEVKTLAPRNDVSDEEARVQREKFVASQKARQVSDRLEAIDSEIERLEREINRHQKSMDDELASLRTKKLAAANNLAGATWEQSLSSEMQSVTSKYQTKIGIARDRIKALREERSSLSRRD